MSKRFKTGIIVIILISVSFFYAMLFYNKGIVMIEEGQILSEAARICNGEVLYRDIDSFVSPGVWYTVAFVFKLFGQSLNLTRWVMVVLFSLTAGLLYAISTHFISSWKATIPVFLLLMHKALAFPIGNFINYPEFAIFFGFSSLFLWFLYLDTGKKRYLFFTGTSLGLTISFKQNIGIYLFIGFCALVLFSGKRKDNKYRKLFTVIIGTISILFPWILYFYFHGAFDEMVYGFFVTPLTSFYKSSKIAYLPFTSLWNGFSPLEMYMYFPSLYWSEFIFPHSCSWLSFISTPLVKIIVGMAYLSPFLLPIGLILLCVKGKLTFKGVSLCVFCYLIFLGIFPRADWAHLMTVFPPFIVLIVYVFSAFKNKYLSYIASLLVGIVTIVSFILIVKMPYDTLMELPKAKLFLSSEQNKSVTVSLQKIEEMIPKDEFMMVVPGEAMYYFLASRPVPTRYTVLFAANIAKDKGETVLGRIRQLPVRYIVYTLYHLPGLPRLEEYAPSLYWYINQNYAPIFTVDNYLQLLEQKRIIE